MKVRLTSYGVPFGRPMYREVAQAYIDSTKFSVSGIHYRVVEV